MQNDTSMFDWKNRVGYAIISKLSFLFCKICQENFV